MHLIDTLKSKLKKKQKIKFGKFNCLIGAVEAEIFPTPTYQRSEQYFKWCSDPFHTSYEKHNLSEKEMIAVTILHNFKGDYSVYCPKMNLNHEDDGGCFSVETDAPGTCLAAPQKSAASQKRGGWLYNHKWCPYLPNIKERTDETFIATIPNKLI